MIYTRFCPAKVNLFLEVTGKRPNGYHELATLFAKIKLGDTLTVAIEPNEPTEISLTLTGPIGKRLRADETNLVCRAARGFLEHFKLTARLSFTLHKRVPTGAGLGGGSSDAANTLRILCDAFHKDKTELLPLAAKLGADVPLFMYDDTFLLGEGIGEKLTPVPCAGKLPWLVLIYPNAFISTKMVFGNFQLPDETQIQTNIKRLENLISCIKQGRELTAWTPFLFNRLESCVTPISHPVEHALNDLRAAGGKEVLMSGSGSTVFALLPTADEAERLARDVCAHGRTVFCTPFYTPEL